jgi:hypothetical protein
MVGRGMPITRSTLGRIAFDAAQGRTKLSLLKLNVAISLSAAGD